MSGDFRRRRRLNTGTRRNGGNGNGNGVNPWLVTIFAALVVIIGGWFLGQALARVFNGPPKSEQVAKAPTPLPIVTPPASPSGAPTATPAASATPAATQSPRPTPEPTPTAAPTATPAPTTAPTVAPTIAPSVAATEAATVAPKIVPVPPVKHTRAPENPAARIVTAYIDALRRGDPAAASTYLGNGSPDESFIDAATRITSITSTPNGDGSYKVAVDMQTSNGEYYETFTVASNHILDKTAIKP